MDAAKKQRIHDWGGDDRGHSLRDKLVAALLWSAAIGLAVVAAWVLHRESNTIRDDDSLVVRKFAVLEERIRDLEVERASDHTRIEQLEAARALTPFRSEPVLAAERRETKPPGVSTRRVEFEVGLNHQRELLPGVSLRLTETDVSRQSFDGRLSLSGGRTFDLREQRIQRPFALAGKGSIVATRVTRYSVLGYVNTSVQ